MVFAPDSRRLDSGGHDGTILIWDVARFTWQRDPDSKLGASEREKCWELLRADNAAKAYGAINRLVADPRRNRARLG